MKKFIFRSLITSILLISVFTIPVSAGVEPSPFQPQTDICSLVSNTLAQLNERIQLIMKEPRETAAEELYKISAQMDLVSTRLFRAMQSIKDNEEIPGELGEAVYKVYGETNKLVDLLNEYLGLRKGYSDEVVEALLDNKMASHVISGQTQKR